MADALKEEYDVSAEMIPGGGGVFDVVVDGTRVYSKQETGRFPEHHEIIHAIDKLIGGGT